MDGEGTDRAFLVFAHPIRFIGGIQVGSGGIQSQTSGTVGWNHDETACVVEGTVVASGISSCEIPILATRNPNDAGFCFDTILSYPRAHRGVARRCGIFGLIRRS